MYKEKPEDCPAVRVSGHLQNVCSGCNRDIRDRFYVQAVDRRWHNECLKCHQCGIVLSNQLTCFSKNGLILCKDDYHRTYAKQTNRRSCSRCFSRIHPSELIMRARDLVYHLKCFVCHVCLCVLNQGDYFGISNSAIYCKYHYEMVSSEMGYDNKGNLPPMGHEEPGFVHPPLHSLQTDCAYGPYGDHHPALTSASSSSSIHELQSLSEGGGPTGLSHSGGGSSPMSRPISGSGSGGPICNVGKKGRPRKKKNCLLHLDPHSSQPQQQTHLQELSLNPNSPRISMPPDPYGDGGQLPPCDFLAMSGAGQEGQPGARTKRMRTTFKHQQLRIMKSYFEVNPNPDAKDLKQLSQKTGLCKRVLQVWFQNARAKSRRTSPRLDPMSQTTASGGTTPTAGFEDVHSSLSSEGFTALQAPPGCHSVTSDDGPCSVSPSASLTFVDFH